MNATVMTLLCFIAAVFLSTMATLWNFHKQAESTQQSMAASKHEAEPREGMEPLIYGLRRAAIVYSVTAAGATVVALGAVASYLLENIS